MSSFDLQLIHTLQEKFETLQQKINDKTVEIDSIKKQIDNLNKNIEELSGEKDSKQLILNTLISEKTKLLSILDETNENFHTIKTSVTKLLTIVDNHETI